MRATIGRVTTQKIRLNNNGGILQSTTPPFTLKNQVTEIHSIEDIQDVQPVESSAGATLVYNPSNDKYEVRKLTSEDVSDNFGMDGGEF